MVIYFSVMLLTALGAGFGIALRPALRRALVATTAPPTSVPEAAAATEPPALELPAELQHLPEPPLLEAAAVEILDPPEITKRLRNWSWGSRIWDRRCLTTIRSSLRCSLQSAIRRHRSD